MFIYILNKLEIIAHSINKYVWPVGLIDWRVQVDSPEHLIHDSGAGQMRTIQA